MPIPRGSWRSWNRRSSSSKVWEFRIRTEVAVALAGSDPEEAAAVAESIADPAAARRGLDRGGRCPPAPPSDRASSPCSIAPRSTPGPRRTRSSGSARMGDVAERLYELGEVEKARALFAEGLRSPTR